MKIRNKNITKSDKIKSTKEGKLYIDSKDFWNDKIIIETTKTLSDYKIKDGKLKSQA